MSEIDKLIERINELANKKKSTGLTEEETIEQQEARKKYIDWFKKRMRNQLDNIDFEFVDEDKK